MTATIMTATITQTILTVDTMAGAIMVLETINVALDQTRIEVRTADEDAAETGWVALVG